MAHSVHIAEREAAGFRLGLRPLRVFCAAVIVLCCPGAVLAAANATIRNGDLFVTTPDGRSHMVLAGDVEEAATSLDGRFAAVVRLSRPAPGRAEEEEEERSTLYLVDLRTAKVERLVQPHASDEPRRVFLRPRHPVFSLDSQSVFVSVDAWATAAAIHRIRIVDRTDHFVIDGNSNDVVPVGRWRGNLVVWRHLYRRRGSGGSYDIAQIVSPTGKILGAIPGSGGPRGEAIAFEWLERHKMGFK